MQSFTGMFRGLEQPPVNPNCKQIHPNHGMKQSSLYKSRAIHGMGSDALGERTHFLSLEMDEVFGFQFHNEKERGSSGNSVQFHRWNRGQDPEQTKNTGKSLCGFN